MCPQDFHLFSTLGVQRAKPALGPPMAAQRIFHPCFWPPCRRLKRQVRREHGNGFLGPKQGGRFWIKRSSWRFLRNRLNPSRTAVPESKPRGRGQFQVFQPVIYTMPDERREIRIKRPASHTRSRRFIFYSTRKGGAQEGGARSARIRCDGHHRPAVLFTDAPRCRR
jgi:hypothetical protein